MRVNGVNVPTVSHKLKFTRLASRNVTKFKFSCLRNSYNYNLRAMKITILKFAGALIEIVFNAA